MRPSVFRNSPVYRAIFISSVAFVALMSAFLSFNPSNELMMGLSVAIAAGIAYIWTRPESQKE